MRPFLVVVLTIAPVAVLADGGSHFHPHGIEYGWVIAAAVGVAAGWLLTRMRK